MNTHPLRAALVAALALSALPAAAQTWVSLDGSPAGTPAEIVLDEASSNASETIFDVFVHGFFTEDVAPGDGNVYQRISVPGLSQLGLLGEPELPVVRERLAVSTGSSIVFQTSVTDLDPHVFAGQLIYPTPVEATDEAFDPSKDPGPGDPDGSAEVFTIDAAVYAGGLYPSVPGIPAVIIDEMYATIPYVTAEAYPVRFDPSTGTLHVSGHLRVVMLATGSPTVSPPMTRDRAALCEATFLNWPEQAPFFPTDLAQFRARYLIVTPEAYLGRLQLLERFLGARGFAVSFLTLESLTAATCTTIRGAIGTWYTAGDPWADHYALLIGDSDVLPQCPSPTTPSIRSDDPYGSPFADDLDERIFVGRLSVDGADDLSDQLQKLVAYVTDDDGSHYETAVVTADDDGAPAGYEANAQAIVGGSYATSPVFSTIFGADGTTSPGDIVTAAQKGFGVLAYRGHATQTTWWEWTGGDTFHKNELLGVGATNLGVVWSFSCWNHELNHDTGGVDALGEAWLEVKGSGAVASYGSGDQAGTRQNDALATAMFDALYDDGILRHAQAIALAESRALDAVPGDNAWMYGLLGEPSMRVRREKARKLVLQLPPVVPVCPTGSNCTPITVRLTDEFGVPVVGGLVTLYKAGAPGEPADVLVTGYTDSNGNATLPAGPSDLQAGLDGTGSDPFGNDVVGSAGVVEGVWANFGGGIIGDAGFPLVQGTGPLTPASEIRVRLENTPASAAAGLFVGLAGNATPFKGGTLYPVPWALLLNLVTDAQGEIEVVAAMPALPGGTELWFQFAIADDAAPSNISLSNAVQGTVP